MSPFPALKAGGLCALLAFSAAAPASAETIVVDGKTIENAEMQALSETGVQFKTPKGLVTLPWAELNAFQKAAVHSQFMEPLENLRIRAVWVEGTVFEVTEDGGVVVQISLDLKGDSQETKPDAEKPVEWKKGAEVVKGMVLIKDMTDSRAKNPGDPVVGLHFRTGRTFTYEVGGFNLIKELPVLTDKRPEWATEREWTNVQGQKLKARLIGVKEGRCLLISSGKPFPYDIDQLSAEDHTLIAEYQKRVRQIPVP